MFAKIAKVNFKSGSFNAVQALKLRTKLSFLETETRNLRYCADLADLPTMALKLAELLVSIENLVLKNEAWIEGLVLRRRDTLVRRTQAIVEDSLKAAGFTLQANSCRMTIVEHDTELALVFPILMKKQPVDPYSLWVRPNSLLLSGRFAASTCSEGLLWTEFKYGRLPSAVRSRLTEDGLLAA